MIVVTGAAGFIGSCIVARLNQMGCKDLIVVDDIGNPDPRENPDGKPDTKRNDLKKTNLKDKKYAQYLDKNDFITQVIGNKLKGIDAVIHMGACSSTTLQDADYFRENNLEYTKTLAKWALDNGLRFIYASSAATYGEGEVGYKDDEATTKRCQPLNLYGQSKQDFDMWALNEGVLGRMVGLKFFNVFGPNEYHKGEMRSVVAKAYRRVAQEGKMALFKSYRPDYKDGGQKRDFVYVKDAVDVVIFFLENEKASGIFNVGTGEARSWNDLANALFKAAGKKPDIEYIEMPEYFF